MEIIATIPQFISDIFETHQDIVMWYKPVKKGAASKINADFTIAWCNGTAEKVLRKSRSLILGQTISDTTLFDDDTRKRVLEFCHKVWLSGATVETSYYNIYFERYFHVQISKAGDGLLCISRDNTLLLNLEIEKEKQEALLYRVIEQSHYGVCLYESIRDTNNRIIDFKLKIGNKKGADALGLSIDEMRRLSITNLLDANLLNFSMEELTGVVEKKEAAYAEYLCERLQHWVGLSIVKFEDGLLLSFGDISSAKSIEQSAATLQTILDATETGICLLEAIYENDGTIKDFVIRNANKAAVKYRGIPSIDINDTLVSKWLPGYKANDLFNQFLETLQSGEKKQSSFHYGLYNQDIWFNVVSTKVDQQVLATFHDITDEKQLQLKLENSVTDLKKSNANLEEFTYAASHDLQEPLRKINYFSDRLRNKITGLLSDEDINLFTRMESAASRMQVLINDLLTYSRVSNKPIALSQINLDELIQLVLQDLETTIALKQAQITKDSLPVIEGDQIQIRQFFVNLLSNSLKYNKPDTPPAIQIKYSTQERFENDRNVPYHVISISDNGIGFEQKYASQIFKVFQRLHGLSEYPGTGVGLAIAQKVVENHRGFIEVQSAPKEGATFTTWLPA